MREILIAAAVVALSGCAAHYGPITHKGGALGGYQDVRLNDDTWRITYQNSDLNFVQRANVDDMTMLRAADLTAANGFSCFVVQQQEPLAQLQHKRHTGTITVKMHKEKPQAGECYDAALVAQQLRQITGAR